MCGEYTYMVCLCVYAEFAHFFPIRARYHFPVLDPKAYIILQVHPERSAHPHLIVWVCKSGELHLLVNGLTHEVTENLYNRSISRATITH